MSEAEAIMIEQDKTTANAAGTQDKPAAQEARPEFEKQAPKDVTALTVVGSVFRAWFGVQTEENRQRDFNANKPGAFIAAGIIFTVLMIVGVIIAVNIALSGTAK